MSREITAIKQILESNIGEQVIVTVQLGRNRKRKRQGILKETYRSVFIVELDENSALERVSFSYSDVLTHAIEVTLV